MAAKKDNKAKGAASCEECKGIHFRASDIPGLVVCRECGLLQPGDAKALTKLGAVVEPKALPETEGEYDPGIPDYTEPMLGWRAWKIRPTAGYEHPCLHSAAHKFFWVPRQNVEAVCSKPNMRLKEDHVPGENCSCGLYAAKTKEHLFEMGYNNYNAVVNGEYTAIGLVKLWGKVIEGGQGWRAQKGYPHELYIPFEAWELATVLEKAYGVPVRLNNILGTSVAEV